MSEAAHVTAVSAIIEFRGALGTFHLEAREGLSAAGMEIRRAFDWLEERRQHWQRAVRDREEEVAQAKADLARRKLFKLFDRPPDCTEQEEALRLAKHRLAEAEAKAENCRRWLPALKRAVEEYDGPIRRLEGLVEGDLPKAVALLERLVAALESYTMLAPPTPIAPQSPPAGKQS
jgi:hypothetical protein